MGREILKDSEDLHPTFMNHPKNPVALEGKMKLGSAGLDGGEEGEADKHL